MVDDNKKDLIVEKKSSILWDIMYYVSVLSVLIVVLLGQQQSKAPKVIFGHSILRVLTTSMQSEIPKDSLIVTKSVNADLLQIGDDITFMVGPTTSVTHRIVGIIEDYKDSGQRGFETKGIENKHKDSQVVVESNVVGKVIFHNYYLGKVVSYIVQKWHMILLYLVLYIIFKKGIMHVLEKKDKKSLEQIGFEDEEDQNQSSINNQEEYKGEDADEN